MTSSVQWDDIQVHRERFDTFAHSYLNGPHSPMLDLKYRHSLLVFSNSQHIVQSEGLHGVIGRSALLAALYHDVGRFPQVVRWHTFLDAKSENHAYLGVKVLKKNKMLADEPKEIQKYVLMAIALHNRYSVPEKLPELFQLITYIVRDSDKLDILRVMAEHVNAPNPTKEGGEVVLGVKDEPEKWSQNVAEKVLQGKIPGYKNMVYINDFRMLLGSWLNDLHFAAARKQMAESGHVEAVLSGLPDAPALRPVRQYLNNLLAKTKC